MRDIDLEKSALKSSDLINARTVGIRNESNDCPDNDGCDGDCGCDEI